MARKVGQWEEEDVAQSDEEEERRQPAMKRRRCRVTEMQRAQVAGVRSSSSSTLISKSFLHWRYSQLLQASGIY
ncbi:hypothetical protein STEG23_036020 [Scotinomys teguina]